MNLNAINFDLTNARACAAASAMAYTHPPSVAVPGTDTQVIVVEESDHIIIAWGRDFGDVSPLRGVIVGGGRHRLSVRVSVQAE